MGLLDKFSKILKHNKVIADTNWFLSELSSYITQELKEENTLLYDAQGRKIKQDIVFESKIRRDLALKLSLAILSVVKSKKVDLNDKLAMREHTLKDFDKKEKERAKNEYSHQKNLTYKLDITSFKITLNYKTSRGEITGSIPLGKIFLSLLGYKAFIELVKSAALAELLHNIEDILDFDVREDSLYDEMDFDHDNASNDEMDFDHDNVSSDTADIDYTVYRKFGDDSDGGGDFDGD